MTHDKSALQSRFSRQTRLREIGVDGQEKLLSARVAVVGVGALGCASALFLLRAGVRNLTLIDRDFVEIHNLPRQILFTEKQALDGAPKAVAALEQLKKIDSESQIEVFVKDLAPGNIRSLLDPSDVIVDGLDNFEGRYLINDYAVQSGKPWVYGGAVGTAGMVFPIVPGKGACLRCLFLEPPETGTADTCETVGVLPTVPAIIAALQVTEVIKLLVGDTQAIAERAIALDLWGNMFQQVPALLRQDNCPCCRGLDFPYLSGHKSAHAETLCGRNAVQVQSRGLAVTLADIASRLPEECVLKLNEWILRFEVEGTQITLFQDGRAIMQGLDDTSRARALYSKYIGN